MTKRALSPGSVPPGQALSDTALLIEKIRPVYGMIGHTAWSTLTISMLAALVLRDQQPQVWIWLGVQIALKLETQIELRWFTSEAALEAHPRWMARRLVITQACHAIGWASLVWVASQHGTPTQLAIVVMILAGIVAGGASTYGPYAPVHATYLLTFAACQAVILVLERGLFATNSTAFAIPILLILYCLGMYNNSRVTSRTFHEHIMLSIANARLVGQLHTEIAAVDAARRDADAANASKSTVLAAASHDLRQPIHALGLFLALLEPTPLDREQRETVRNCKAALTASSSMLDTLLDFSRSEAGVIEPQVEPFVIGDVLGMVEQEIGILADEKRIVYRTHDCQAVVESDPALVKMIVINLVSNAIRYTRQGGVLVGCRRRGDRIVVEVWDSGVGIAADQLGAIFGEFVQLANPERDRRKGLGLGLAIATRLARLLGSAIEVRSVEGRGSVFRFALPRSDQTPVARPGAPQQAVPALPGETARRHILIVDDDDAVRKGLSAVLIAAGHSVDAAEDRDQALAHARNRQPDLVICDFRLRAGCSGLDVVAAVRLRSGAMIPALLVTGDTHPDRVAMAAGASMETLYKPVEPDQILARVAHLCCGAH